MALVQKYFGPAKSQTAPGRVLAVMPEKPKTGSATAFDTNARTPGFIFGFMIPPSRTPDHYALEMAALILTNGESSRLYKKLVHDRAVAERISAGTDDHRGPDQFSVMGVLTEKGKLPDVEAAVDAELAQLRKTPPSLAELEKAKRQLRAMFVFGLQTNNGRAIQLGEFEASYSDARLLARELSQYLAVTPPKPFNEPLPATSLRNADRSSKSCPRQGRQPVNFASSSVQSMTRFIALAALTLAAISCASTPPAAAPPVVATPAPTPPAPAPAADPLATRPPRASRRTRSSPRSATAGSTTGSRCAS